MSRRRGASRKCRTTRTRAWDAEAAIFRAAAHPDRLRILCCLAEAPRCVCDINRVVPISQPMLSQHMAALKEAGLVASHARSNRRCYYLIRPTLVRALLGLRCSDHEVVDRSRDEVFCEMEARRRTPRGGRSKRASGRRR
jgi:ArsR family transcriptional regulator